MPDVTVEYVCDVDDKILGSRAQQVQGAYWQAAASDQGLPQGVG
jgi:hypothetical protein